MYLFSIPFSDRKFFIAIFAPAMFATTVYGGGGGEKMTSSFHSLVDILRSVTCDLIEKSLCHQRL